MTIKNSLFGLAMTGVFILGTASTAMAKAHHLAPQAFDTERPAAGRSSAGNAASDCFVEPEGFHSQIRWDAACVAARAQARGDHIDSGAKAKFEAPRGFHSQIRWD